MGITTASPSSPLLSRKKAPVPASLEVGAGMGATAANPYTAGHWSQSIIIRTVLGVFFSVGLTLAATRLTDGLLILTGENVKTFWNSLVGFAAWQGEQFCALFLATLFAAAGLRRTLLLGLLLGAISGFGTLSTATPPANVPVLYYALLPSWHIMAAILGAALSRILWQPPSREKPRGSSSLAGYEVEQTIGQLIRRAIAGTVFANVKWLRILVAVVVILLALRFVDDAYDYVIRALNLHETVTRIRLDKRAMIFLVQAVIVFLAAGLAGAGQNHGPAHGFWTGVIAGVVNLLLHVFLPKEQVLPVNEILVEIGWVFCLSLAAGGIGAMLLPPMIYIARRRRNQIKVL